MMIRYEIKKIFSKKGSKAAMLFLVVAMAVTLYFAMNVSYVDEKGTSHKGKQAMAELRERQKRWTGLLDEEKIQDVIRENRRIQNTPEAQSDENRKNNIAYGWRQGIQGIRELLNKSYATDFREYDYYRADSLTEEQAGTFYTNRVKLLKEWLTGEAKELFSSQEKEYLIEQYEQQKTPFFYDYMLGWTQIFEYAGTILMLFTLIACYLVSGIFSDEFRWKADAVFFSSFYGRNRGVRAKILAGVSVVTVLYFAVFLTYTAILLWFFGRDGWNCPVQASLSGWKCFYHVTVGEQYLFILLGGYIGVLFFTSLAMFVSAKTRSAIPAVVVPFLFLLLPSFLSNFTYPFMQKFLGLLPEQLLQVGETMKQFHLYTFGEHTVGSISVLYVLYFLLTLLLLPIIYMIYKKKEIR